MAKLHSIDQLLQQGSKEWNQLRKDGRVSADHTGATFSQLYSANADLSGLVLIGSEWEKCDLSKVNFREADLSNAYFHGGRLQDCDFRGAKLDGATFERVKLLRCDFSGASGLDDLELDDVDTDRVVGLDGETPPPPPPPAFGINAFTKAQRDAVLGKAPEAPELPPFRPFDGPATLLFRGLKGLGQPPAWVLDVPGLRPPLPTKLPPGTSLETLYRDAVKTRLENRRASADATAVERAKAAVQTGSPECAVAVMYLKEVGEVVVPTPAAVDALNAALEAEIDEEDLTGSVDPRITGSLLELKAGIDATRILGDLQPRLAACTLFISLLEAGFAPDNNWEEALDSTEASQDLAAQASGQNRELLKVAFNAFADLPREVQLRRMAHLAEACAHLEAMLPANAAV